MTMRRSVGACFEQLKHTNPARAKFQEQLDESLTVAVCMCLRRAVPGHARRRCHADNLSEQTLPERLTPPRSRTLAKRSQERTLTHTSAPRQPLLHRSRTAPASRPRNQSGVEACPRPCLRGRHDVRLDRKKESGRRAHKSQQAHGSLQVRWRQLWNGSLPFLQLQLFTQSSTMQAPTPTCAGRPGFDHTT